MHLDQENKELPVIIPFYTGTNLIKHRPLFSRDSKYLFIPCGNSVHIYSTASGECVQQLSSHPSLVVSVCINPENKLQLLAVHQTGEIVFWDYEDAVKLKVITLDLTIHSAFTSGLCNNLYVLKWSADISNVGGYELLKFNLDSKKAKPLFITVAGKNERSVAFGNKTKYIAAINRNKLRICVLENEYVKRTTNAIVTSNLFTCVACHPTEDCVATGDSLGRILLWYEFINKKGVFNVKHWHQFPVEDLCFSAVGSYLFSGGSEAVLVKWFKDADRQFLPRLGMPIKYISVSSDGSYIAISHVDNVITMVNSQMVICHILQGLIRRHKWTEVDNKSLPAGIIFDNRSKCIVLNGKPGHLQFYNLFTDKLIYNLDITNQNYISGESHVYGPLEVLKAAFSQDGYWLATFEYRNDGETSPEIRLKFWAYNELGQNYSLNTIVEYPHSEKLNTIIFQPISSYSESECVSFAVTTSNDKQFKLWSYIKNSSDEENTGSWRCESVGYYCELYAGDASFSDDGSVLAVAFDSILTLWLPDSNVMQAALSHPHHEMNSPIQQVEFGHGKAVRFVVCSMKNLICSWNTLTLSVLWYANVCPSFLIMDPFSEFMCAFDNKGNMFVFHPSNPNPVFMKKNASANPILCAIFLPREDNLSNSCKSNKWQSNSNLIFMDNEQVLYGIMGSQDIIKKQDDFQLNKSSLSTPFSRIIAEQTSFTSSPKEDLKKFNMLGVPSSKAIQKMMNAPSHVLPSTDVLCKSFLGTLLEPHKINSAEDCIKVKESVEFKSESESFEDSDVDSEEDGEEVKYNPPMTVQYDSESDEEFKIRKLNSELKSKLPKVNKEDYSWLTSIYSEEAS